MTTEPLTSLAGRIWSRISPKERARRSMDTVMNEQRFTKLKERRRLAWGDDPPRDAWHSFDRTPQRHPWLTPGNIKAFREFSEGIHAEAAKVSEGIPLSRLKYGFICNIANCLYVRASPLRKMGVRINMYHHPGDRFVTSEPAWEHFTGTIPDGTLTIDQLDAAGISLPEVEDVYRYPIDPGAPRTEYHDLPDFIREEDFLNWPDYLAQMPTMKAVQDIDALLALQRPYLAYLSNRPYLAAQMGGDFWLDCSRDDMLGRLMRKTYNHATAFIMSNPWSLSHARRYGMNNLVFLQAIFDEEFYSPGTSDVRKEWEQKSGGSFFVISTARLDDWKRNDIGLDGFARFLAKNPDARLVLMYWGEKKENFLSKLSGLGIEDRVIFLPFSGKAKLVEYLRGADCMIDQFSYGNFGFTAVEAMGCGLPVILRFVKDQYDSLYEGAPPMIYAETPEHVSKALEKLYESKDYRKDVGQGQRTWFVENMGARTWGERYSNLLIATALGHTFDFGNSPLTAPLTREEIEYHEDQLDNAPDFPNYM